MGPRETAWGDRIIGRPPGRFVWVAEVVVSTGAKILLLAIKMANNLLAIKMANTVEATQIPSMCYWLLNGQ